MDEPSGAPFGSSAVCDPEASPYTQASIGDSIVSVAEHRNMIARCFWARHTGFECKPVHRDSTCRETWSQHGQLFSACLTHQQISQCLKHSSNACFSAPCLQIALARFVVQIFFVDQAMTWFSRFFAANT